MEYFKEWGKCNIVFCVGQNNDYIYVAQEYIHRRRKSIQINQNTSFSAEQCCVGVGVGQNNDEETLNWG